MRRGALSPIPITFYLLLLLTIASSFHFQRTFDFSKSSIWEPQQKIRLFSSKEEIEVNALPDCKRRLAQAAEKVSSNLAKDVLNVAYLKQTVKDMEQESSQPEFWDDQAKAQEVLGELNRVKMLVARADGWKTSCDDVETIIELANESQDDACKIIKIH